MEEQKQYMGSSGNEKYFCMMDFWANDDRTLFILNVNFEDRAFSCKRESDGKTSNNIRAIAELLNEAAVNLCLFNTNAALRYVRGEVSKFDSFGKVYPNTPDGLNAMYSDHIVVKSEVK